MPTGNPDYTQNVKIIGRDPSGNPVAVAVDADGNIVAVLKGEYQGTLKTLATDEDGRIIAVITDPENIWGVRPVIGNTELAARLKSPVYFERNGQVIFIEDFSEGKDRWTLDTIATGGALELIAGKTAIGGYALKVVSGTGTTPETYALTYLPYPTTTGKFGIEAHFRPDQYTSALIITIALWTGSWLWQWSIIWYMSDGSIYYLDENGNNVDTGQDVGAAYGETLFHAMKLVIDLDTGKYTRLYINPTQIDLSNFTGYKTSSSLTPVMALKVGGAGTATDSSDILVDTVIATILEPDT